MPKKNGLEVATGERNELIATERTPLVPKDDAESVQGRPKRIQSPASPPPLPPGARIPQSRGTSTLQAAILIGGEMFGGGLLVLPKAMTELGWFGVAIIIVTCLMAAFNGKRLSDCWTILEARDPELRTKKRNPYAIIAEEALGRKWSAVVSIGSVVTQFGAAVVYLLLAADIMRQLFLTLIPALGTCFWYLILACVMAPILMFVMPKDFLFLGFFAFFSVVVAFILYFVALVNEYRVFVYRSGAQKFSKFFLGVGMIMFSFGGATSFPTIQNDMTDRKQFNTSLKYSFITTLGLYLAVAIGGYAALGNTVAANFADSLSPTSLSLVANVIMVVHLVSAFIVFLNPVCQEMEMLYDIPRDSLGYRVLIRLSIMAAILFIGESIPSFETILALIGGTSIALLAFVLPSYCYLAISQSGSEDSETPTEPPPGWMKVLCWEMVAAGALFGLFAAYSALAAMFGDKQPKPCYLV